MYCNKFQAPRYDNNKLFTPSELQTNYETKNYKRVWVVERSGYYKEVERRSART